MISVISFFVSLAYAKPWNNNTREHLFGTIGADGQAHVSIQDEGFRWRNTFNFNLQDHNGSPLEIANWEFDRVIQWNTKESPEIFSKLGEDWQPNTSPNIIHRHLANIVHNVNRIHRWQCVSVSAAAVTIVVENPDKTYNAYSKILTNNKNNVYVAKIGGKSITQNVINYTTAVNISRLNAFLGSNLPVGYNCTEGQLIDNMLHATRLRWNINQLLARAGQAKHPETIKLIILHIGTSMDPCARCTRCLAGLSRRINYGNNTDVNDNPRGLNNFNGINAKLLVEVSSGSHYLTTTTEADNFARYGYGLCSHTECAGHDGQEEEAINIRLRGSKISQNPSLQAQQLFIPYGNGETGWKFDTTFPPYIVLGRTESVPDEIRAPHGHFINF